MTQNKISGTVVTFYSYKGGVGRSMMLANVAALLSKWGQRVLVIDWDLEAPGLHKYFQQWSVQAPGSTAGVVELMASHRDGTGLSWQSCVVSVSPPKGREIHVLAAGKDDDSYASRLRSLDWERLFAQNGLGNYLEAMRREWKSEYDFTLVDSRTGVTDIGGICTIHLPDLLVAVFTANEQSLMGVRKVLESARRGHAKLPVDRRKLMVVPVPSRDESTSEHLIAEQWRERFSKELNDFFKDWVPTGERNTTVLNLLKIPYFPYWSFGERVPVLEQDDPDNPKTLAYSYQPLARLLLGRLDYKEAREGTQATEEAQRLTAEAEKARLEATRLMQEAQLRAEMKEHAELERKEKERAERIAALELRINSERERWGNLAKSKDKQATWIMISALLVTIGFPWLLHSYSKLSVSSCVGVGVVLGLVGFLMVGFVALQEDSAKALADGLLFELQRYRSNVPPYASLNADESVALLAATVDENLQNGLQHFRSRNSYKWRPAVASSAGQQSDSAPVKNPPEKSGQHPTVETSPKDYEYDVYVSYPRAQVVSDWLNLFLPLLSDWLGEDLGRVPRIFSDRSIQGGDSFPNEVKSALRGSRCLLPVLTPSYFQSQFCMAEFRSFQAREGRAVIPILFRGQGQLTEEFRAIQVADFSQFTFAGEAFKLTPRYIDFQEAVRRLSPVLAEAIRRAPPFDPDAPVLSPVDVKVSPLEIPRV